MKDQFGKEVKVGDVVNYVRMDEFIFNGKGKIVNINYKEEIATIEDFFDLSARAGKKEYWYRDSSEIQLVKVN